MEAVAVLKLCKYKYGNSKYKSYIGTIISNNDSTIPSHLKHKKDSVKIPNHIPPPTFLTDPSHQVKNMAKLFSS